MRQGEIPAYFFLIIFFYLFVYYKQEENIYVKYIFRYGGKDMHIKAQKIDVLLDYIIKGVF